MYNTTVLLSNVIFSNNLFAVKIPNFEIIQRLAVNKHAAYIGQQSNRQQKVLLFSFF